MATEASLLKRNLESSILFMQTEHATTLKALHDEIFRLQKRCTDLTFQLTMNGINVEEEADVDTRLTDVQKKLSSALSKEGDLEQKLKQSESKLVNVEKEARILKKRHLDEMRNATQTINGLKADVS